MCFVFLPPGCSASITENLTGCRTFYSTHQAPPFDQMTANGWRRSSALWHHHNVSIFQSSSSTSSIPSSSSTSIKSINTENNPREIVHEVQTPAAVHNTSTTSLQRNLTSEQFLYKHTTAYRFQTKWDKAVDIRVIRRHIIGPSPTWPVTGLEKTTCWSTSSFLSELQHVWFFRTDLYVCHVLELLVQTRGGRAHSEKVMSGVSVPQPEFSDVSICLMTVALWSNRHSPGDADGVTINKKWVFLLCCGCLNI